MPKNICVKCEVEFKPFENGVIVAEMFQNNTALYRLWSADLWQCPKCGYQIVSGYGNHAYAEHFEQNLEKIIAEETVLGKKIIYSKEFRE